MAEATGEFARLGTDLAAAFAAERDRADRAEAALAEAWDEGYDAGAGGEYHELGTNPYRSEATA